MSEQNRKPKKGELSLCSHHIFLKFWSYFSLCISRLRNVNISKPSVFNILDLTETDNMFTTCWG